MTILDRYKSHKNCKIDTRLLWEYNMEKFDWNYSRGIVVERVIERGSLNDFYAAINLYGGMENFLKIIREDVRHLRTRDLLFICTIFGLRKEDLRCYRQQQLRNQRLNS